MFLPFICLALPDDSPFWTARENEGIWETLGDESEKVVLEKPGLALIIYHGWDEIDCLVHSGRNAEAEESTVLYTHKKRTAKNPAMELMITVMLHKTDDSEWTEEELSPIQSIHIMDITPTYSALRATLTLSDGKTYEIDFVNIDGNRTC